MADLFNLAEVGEALTRGVSGFWTPEFKSSDVDEEVTMVAKARQAVVALALVNTGAAVETEKKKEADEQASQTETKAAMGAVAAEIAPLQAVPTPEDETAEQIKAMAEEHAKQQSTAEMPDLRGPDGHISVEKAATYLEGVLREAA